MISQEYNTMNLKQATIYDSVFNKGSALLKPIHHLQLKLDITNTSMQSFTKAYGNLRRRII